MRVDMALDGQIANFPIDKIHRADILIRVDGVTIMRTARFRLRDEGGTKTGIAKVGATVEENHVKHERANLKKENKGK